VVRDAVTEKTLELIRTATQGNSKSSASLHTLATILAELGRTMEAKDALTQEFELRGAEELGVNEWYVLGRIAEQLGVPEAAKACYDRSVALGSAKEAADEDTCTALALRRLKGLKKT
jgi:Flp pilus assembly protein TadD